jgi:hypothetical protein
MSRLKDLLRVATPSLCNKQQTVLQACAGVAQHTHGTQQPMLHVAPPSTRNTQQHDCEQWREFESLLEIVAPAYNTPAHELDEIRAVARRDLPAALLSYRILLKQRTSEGALNE